MTKLEALRLELAAREMVEGTGLEWREVIRRITNKEPIADNFSLAWVYREELELALGVLEGKPVWKHDKLWFTLFSGDTHYLEVLGTDGQNFNGRGWCYAMSLASWNPPKAKTVTVELLVEDACDLARPSAFNHQRIMEACRKALENLK